MKYNPFKAFLFFYSVSTSKKMNMQLFYALLEKTGNLFLTMI